MIFLIEYDRGAGRLQQLKTYDNSMRREAATDRLRLELDLLKLGSKHEVVLLEAASEEDLRLTHSRYFGNLADLLAAGGKIPSGRGRQDGQEKRSQEKVEPATKKRPE